FLAPTTTELYTLSLHDALPILVVAVRPAVLLVLSLALALSSAQASAQDWSGIDEAAVDAVGSGEVPGIVVVVGRGDDIVYRRARSEEHTSELQSRGHLVCRLLL